MPVNELPRNLLWDKSDLRLTQPPGVPVQAADHAGINLHIAGEELALLGRQIFPGKQGGRRGHTLCRSVEGGFEGLPLTPRQGHVLEQGRNHCRRPGALA